MVIQARVIRFGTLVWFGAASHLTRPVIRYAIFGLAGWFGMVVKNTTEQGLVLSVFYNVPGYMYRNKDNANSVLDPRQLKTYFDSYSIGKYGFFIFRFSDVTKSTFARGSAVIASIDKTTSKYFFFFFSCFSLNLRLFN
jgi:hypothetical protein